MAVGVVLFAALALVLGSASANPSLAPVPPMGWMSWEIFRCEIDCEKHPDSCINEALYKAQTDRLAADGYLQAGYNGIHLDDCWMRLRPIRDAQNQLVPDPARFPSGFKALGDYMHAKNVSFAIYTAESHETCAGYPASRGYENIDAKTFASWGVDYLKVDGCGEEAYYTTGYPLMGKALATSGRPIVYSCSWPAYLGSNESTKPYSTFIDIGCNLWRNWDDIQCSWGSLSSIIDHFGDYSRVLQQWVAPGHFNDPDMLLVGNNCISDDEARTQMAIWSILAAPLIMGNDLRTVTPSQREILLNPEVIAVDQDKLAKAGVRLSPKNDTEVWARSLSGGSVAVALYNKNAHTATYSAAPCEEWNATIGGYFEACGGSSGDLSCFTSLTIDQAQDACCANSLCAGFSYRVSDNSGCYKTNTDCGIVKQTGYEGFAKPGFKPPAPVAVPITVKFADVGLTRARVRDLWARKDLGVFSGSYTATVAPHAAAFLRLTPA
eukprot:m.223921 g.223921  ORF g.223921 m.223921 type:complete len:494 (-) comp16352_c0_seq1:183-1664(-)